MGKRKDKEAKIKKGELKDYKLGLSKKKMPAYIDSSVVLPEQLPKSFKDVENRLNSQIHEKYDSIFRRGLIEYKSGTRAQRRSKY